MKGVLYLDRPTPAFTTRDLELANVLATQAFKQATTEPPGATFLVLADALARTAAAPAELPIGVVTAFVGVPFFLWLLRRRGV